MVWTGVEVGWFMLVVWFRNVGVGLVRVEIAAVVVDWWRRSFRVTVPVVVCVDDGDVPSRS